MCPVPVSSLLAFVLPSAWPTPLQPPACLPTARCAAESESEEGGSQSMEESEESDDELLGSSSDDEEGASDDEVRQPAGCAPSCY